ncbi:MAG: hypothetical protein AAF355_12160 [Myxococcota bacterium]
MRSSGSLRNSDLLIWDTAWHSTPEFHVKHYVRTHRVVALRDA